MPRISRKTGLLARASLCATLAMSPLIAQAFTTGYQVTFHVHDREFAINEGRSTGHEEITRQALLQARELLLRNTQVNIRAGGEGLVRGLGNYIRGTIGAMSPNLIIRGNYCTDAPHEPNALFSLTEFWFRKSASEIDWHNDPKTQVFHFLRNFKKNGTLVSARRACEEARETISRATFSAVREWQAGNADVALFLIGHATHIIQDSFSPAHTRRDLTDANAPIRDVCYYGDGNRRRLGPKLKNSACYHDVVDLGDGIWIRSNQQEELARALYADEEVQQCWLHRQYMITERSKRSCMKAEARLARDATVKYLYLVATELYQRRVEGRPYDERDNAQLQRRLERELYDGGAEIPGFKNRMPGGIMRCDLLK